MHADTHLAVTLLSQVSHTGQRTDHTMALAPAPWPCRQYVQSRGRGRASDARYVILLQRGAPREAAALERTRREVADMVAAAAQLSHHNRVALARGEPLVRGLGAGAWLAVQGGLPLLGAQLSDCG